MSCGHAAEQARRLELEGRARQDAALRQRARVVQRHILAADHDHEPVALDGLLSDAGACPAACQQRQSIRLARSHRLGPKHDDVDSPLAAHFLRVL